MRGGCFKEVILIILSLKVDAKQTVQVEENWRRCDGEKVTGMCKDPGV